jgi:hypothetical protein
MILVISDNVNDCGFTGARSLSGINCRAGREPLPGRAGYVALIHGEPRSFRFE